MTQNHLLGLALLPLLLAATASSQTYTGYFEVPDDYILHDLEYRDGYLWVMHRNGDRILQIDSADGQEVGTIDLNIDFTPAGLAWDGEHFWISRSQTAQPNRLYKIDANGNILHDIPAPDTRSANGLAWHDGDFWVSRAQPAAAAAHVRVDPADGTELEAIPSPWTQPAGMAFLGDGTFWATNSGYDASPQKLYHLDRNSGELLHEMDMPDGIGRPRGLGYDGEQYLYIVAHTRPGPVHYRIYRVDLLAEGTPVLAYEPPELDFGLVQTDAPATEHITLFNHGDGDLVVEDVALSGSSAFSTTFDGAVIAPGGQTVVPVTFSPETYAPKSATLSFVTNDINNAEVDIPLAGHGLYPQQMLATPASSHNFGGVRIEDPYGRAVRTWPMAIVNQGAQPLTISSLTTKVPFSIEQELDLPFTIGPADTTHVLIGFRPTETGTFTGEVVIMADDPAEPTQTVSLIGTGVDPELDGGDQLWSMTLPDNPSVGFQNRKVHVIRALDDITGDGTPDLVVASRNYWVMALRGNSWGTGEILWSFNTCPHTDNCGAVMGGESMFNTGLVSDVDLNEDGYSDVVFGTGGGNDHVYALSGKDGSVIWAHGDVDDPFLGSYYAVDARFDFDGDGVPDVVAGTGSASGGSPDPYNERRVYLLSGATGEVIWVRQPNPQAPNFVVAQYLGSDGLPRIVAGGHNPAAGPGHVVAYDQQGAQLWSRSVGFTPFLFATVERGDGAEDVLYTGSGSNNRLIRVDGDSGDQVWSVPTSFTVWAIDVVGDVTGSGTDDIVLGDFDGAVTIFDGLDGSVVWSANLSDQAFGVASIGDVTGDGFAEVAVATADGLAHLLSGAGGEVLWTHIVGNGNINQAGEVVMMIPDVDGSGRPEVAVGTRHGRVFLLKSSGDAPVATEPGSTAFDLVFHEPYPNPAREHVTLRFELSQTAAVRIEVFDVIGRRVALLFEGDVSAGAHEAVWDGDLDSRGRASAGIYFVRLSTGENAQVRRVVLVPR